MSVSSLKGLKHESSATSTTFYLFSIDNIYKMLYGYFMVTKRTSATSINLTAVDRKILCKLKTQLEPIHGKLTLTGVIRIAMRMVVRT